MNQHKKIYAAFAILGAGALAVVSLFLFQGRDNDGDRRNLSSLSPQPAGKANGMNGLPTALHGTSIDHEALLRVPVLDETCRKTAIAVSMLDLRSYGAAVRRAADVNDLTIPEEVVTGIEKVRNEDKCAKLTGKTPVARTFGEYRTRCAKLAPNAKDGAHGRLLRLSQCVEALRDFRSAIVSQAYAAYRYDQIRDPRALIILLEGTLRLGGEKQPEETYLIAKQLARLRPDDPEAAVVEAQAAYVRLVERAKEDADRDTYSRDLDDATDRLERLDPKGHRAQEMRLGLLVSQGDTDKLTEAAAEFRRAAPDNEGGAVYTAAGHYMRGDRAAGIAELEMFLREHPTNTRAALSLQMMKTSPEGAAVTEAFLDANRVIFYEQFEEQVATSHH